MLLLRDREEQPQVPDETEVDHRASIGATYHRYPIFGIYLLRAGRTGRISAATEADTSSRIQGNQSHEGSLDA
jgi:hypothetical protein